MITVADVEATSPVVPVGARVASAHGGSEYEMLCRDGAPALELHHWDAHEHPHLGDASLRPYGNGVLL